MKKVPPAGRTEIPLSIRAADKRVGPRSHRNSSDSGYRGLPAALKATQWRSIRPKTGGALFTGICLLLEGFFTSAPSAGPQEGDFTKKRLGRLVGIGDDRVVFLLFQYFFHRTAVDVHQFYSLRYQSLLSWSIHFAIIIPRSYRAPFAGPRFAEAGAANSTAASLHRAAAVPTGCRLSCCSRDSTAFLIVLRISFSLKGLAMKSKAPLVSDSRANSSVA